MHNPSQFGIRIVLLFVIGLLQMGCGRNSSEPYSSPNSGDVSQSVAKAEGKSTSPAAEAQPNQIRIDNFTFQPAKLTVPVGTKVTWINRDDVPHTATSVKKPRVFDSKTLDTDEQYSHVFTAPGTYDYFCAVHPHMKAQIIVK
jgi:plastocyanin